ncbi:MAG: acetate--CoA ligase family protein [Burkholderiaceae bacterium]
MAAYVETLDALGRQFPDVIFITVGMFDAPTVRRLQDAGGLVFTDPSRAVEAARSLAAMGAAFARAPRERPRIDDLVVPAPAAQPNEADGYRLLAAAGLPVPAFHRLAPEGSVSDATAGLAAPYVLKVLSADIAHKSDIGGVRLPLADAHEVASAWHEMRAALGRAAPQARIEGALLMTLQRDFVEVVIGARVDDQLGPVVMVGLGGVFVELLDDIAVRLAPVSAADAVEMIESLKGVRLLHGLRGQPARDVDALADAVSRLSRLIAANAGWMQSIEINPFAVRSRGQGGCALDCAIQLKPEKS